MWAMVAGLAAWMVLKWVGGAGRRDSWFPFFVGVAVALGVGLAGGGGDPAPASAPTGEYSPVSRAGIAGQKPAGEAVLQEFKRRGLITKTLCGATFGELWTRPAFAEATLDDQDAAVGALIGSCQPPEGDYTVRLRDDRTGEIARRRHFEVRP